MFTRIDAGVVPDAKAILKIARVLSPDVIERLHRRVVDVAKRAGVTHGRRFRVDTTVVTTVKAACTAGSAWASSPTMW
jgi:IS5 family transposase